MELTRLVNLPKVLLTPYATRDSASARNHSNRRKHDKVMPRNPNVKALLYVNYKTQDNSLELYLCHPGAGLASIIVNANFSGNL